MKRILAIKQIYDDFISKVMLDEDESVVLDMYLKNKSQVQMCMELNMSERNIARVMKRLKDKFNNYKELEIAKIKVFMS